MSKPPDTKDPGDAPQKGIGVVAQALAVGLGRVEEVSGMGESAMSLIDFGSAGRVKLMHNHAPLQKL